MSIARKRRRPLTYQGREFVWDANDEWQLRVASVDKKFSISVPAVYPPFDPWSKWSKDSIPVWVSGPEFPGLGGRKDVWIRCPTISPDQVVTTPGFVARLLDWCFTETKQIELLDPSE